MFIFKYLLLGQLKCVFKNQAAIEAIKILQHFPNTIAPNNSYSDSGKNDGKTSDTMMRSIVGKSSTLMTTITVVHQHY